MDSPILRQYNAFEIIMFVHEMHQLGYEKLRLLPGMSPNGCAWRWFIYTKVQMKSDNRFEHHGDCVPFDCLFGSSGDPAAQKKSTNIIEDVIRENEDYFNLAKGRDEDYVSWFSAIVEQAKQANYPIAFADCYLADTWSFSNSQMVLQFPPFTPESIDDFTDEQLLKGAPYLFNRSSVGELNEVLNYQGTKPDVHTICDVIRKALKENKGLMNHVDNYGASPEIDLFAWGD